MQSLKQPVMTELVNLKEGTSFYFEGKTYKHCGMDSQVEVKCFCEETMRFEHLPRYVVVNPIHKND